MRFSCWVTKVRIQSGTHNIYYLLPFHSTLVTRTCHIVSVNVHVQFLSFVPTRNLFNFMPISVLWSRHKTLLGFKWLGTLQSSGRLTWNFNILSVFMLKQVIPTVTAVFKTDGNILCFISGKLLLTCCL